MVLVDEEFGLLVDQFLLSLSDIKFWTSPEIQIKESCLFFPAGVKGLLITTQQLTSLYQHCHCQHRSRRQKQRRWQGGGDAVLCWEFQFLVLISGTPIRSGIPIPFLIPKIPVGNFFSNSAVEKLRNQNSDSKIRNSEKKRRDSIHLILHIMLIMIGQPVGLAMSHHMDIGTIPGKGNLSALSKSTQLE